jgi:ubiquitin-protein ligase E3 A
MARLAAALLALPQASRDALLAWALAELSPEQLRDRLVRPLQAHVSLHFRAIAAGRGQMLLAGAGAALPQPPFRRPPLTHGFAFELAVRLLRVLAKACGANLGDATAAPVSAAASPSSAAAGAAAPRAAGAASSASAAATAAATAAPAAATATPRLLPDAAFANADVSDMPEAMLRMDFARWRANSFLRTVQSPIAVCGYGFLLTPAAKRRVVAIEAQEAMSAEAQQASLRNLTSGLGGLGGLAALFGGALGGALGGGGAIESPYLALHVRRSALLRDTLRQLSGLAPNELRKQLKVQFDGEDGVDQGGPTKELFTLLVREIQDPKYGLWVEDAQSRTAWLHPSTSADGASTAEAELLGLLVGLAVHNGVFLDLHFPRAFYKALLPGAPPAGLADLASVNPGLAESLGKLLAFEPAEAVEDTFSLTFEVTYEAFGEPVNVELCAGGAERAVTGANRAEYVAARCDFVLNRSVAAALAAFKRGFGRLLGGPTLRLFSPEDLELLIVGEEALDFHALERVTHYEGYEARSETVRRFWRVVHAMPPPLQKRLLHFVTGSSRAPIGGLGKLPFKVHRNGVTSALPSSSTCYNLLLLPPYETDEKMRERLTLALCEGNESFHLR